MVSRVLVPVLLVLALTGCGADPIPAPGKNGKSGSQGDGSSKAENAGGVDSASYVRCSEVWKAGRTLPSSYQGCSDLATNSIAFPGGPTCKDGTQLLTFDDRFWALTGGRITQVQGGISTDQQYGEELTRCTLG